MCIRDRITTAATATTTAATATTTAATATITAATAAVETTTAAVRVVPATKEAGVATAKVVPATEETTAARPEAVINEGHHALFTFVLVLLGVGTLGFALCVAATSWMLARMERAVRGTAKRADRGGKE